MNIGDIGAHLDPQYILKYSSFEGTSHSPSHARGSVGKMFIH